MMGLGVEDFPDSFFWGAKFMGAFLAPKKTSTLRRDDSKPPWAWLCCGGSMVRLFPTFFFVREEKSHRS